MTEYAYQLYSSRAFPPLEKTLTMLADLGYRRTEGYGGMLDDPPSVRAAHDAAGLVMGSVHLGLDRLRADCDGMIRLAEVLGVSSVYAPHLAEDERPADAAGWTALAHELETLAGAFAGAGLHFGWHNHDFEFRPTAGGAVPMEIVLDAAPSIGWEADIAWVVRGGADPFDWIGRLGDRITAVHIKDIAPAGECADEDGWADVGHGTLDWGRLLTALEDAPVRHFIVEHDRPNDDARFARRSLEALNALTRS